MYTSLMLVLMLEAPVFVLVVQLNENLLYCHWLVTDELCMVVVVEVVVFYQASMNPKRGWRKIMRMKRYSIIHEKDFFL